MASKRKSWMFWVLNNDNMPAQSRGYECPPNDGCYWFPEFGFSTWAVYETRADAAEKARVIAEADIERARQRLVSLDANNKREAG
jgi:hypothetical protein